MAQSNESNERRIASFRPNHTGEPPPYTWTHWSDQFQLAIIAKENLDINSPNAPEVSDILIPTPEQATASKLDTVRVIREARNENPMKTYEVAFHENPMKSESTKKRKSSNG